MARNVKKGVKFYPGVDTQFDKLGIAAGFTSTIMDMSTGSVVKNAGSGVFKELIRPTNGHKGATAAAVAVGATTITVDSTSNLANGDSIVDSTGNYYYITSVSGSTIGLKSPVKVALASGAALTEVGNTGLYKVECQIDTDGEYMVTIAHPEMGNIALKYVIVNNTLDDVSADMDSRFDNVQQSLNGISGGTQMIAIA